MPHGQYCYGTSLETNQNIILACNTCLSGQCIQVMIIATSKTKIISMFQTCCPPGHVYAQDESWEPPRCSSEGAAEDVSNSKQKKKNFD